MERLIVNPNIHSAINDRIIQANRISMNLSAPDLVEDAIKNNEGYLADNGALCVNTGKFTGRSPKDRFIVKDEKTAESVFWGKINKPFDPDKFEKLLNKMVDDLANQNIYIRDAYAGADERYRLNVRVITTRAWHNLFCYNMFIRPNPEELEDFQQNYTVICHPDFEAEPEVDGTDSKNFAIVNITERIIIVGGTAYSGEMKKGIFSVLDYMLPHENEVLGMHCSANIGEDGDTALFFGLSGTGKTTLSTDPNRYLIGDDEHGWSENGIFNFEGGCYAKAINLSEEDEPDIYRAIKFGAIVENTKFYSGTRTINFADDSITQNTRVSYPIQHIDKIKVPSKGPHPKNIFFLTADAFGVLPPIAKLEKSQAMYHFISGYTSKVAGTEQGIDEPQAVFSACFGEPFMPLHPTRYAKLLGEYMKKHDINIWLINTGWTSGPYGTGHRMKLKHTRAMISAAMKGELDDVSFIHHDVFGIEIPETCPDVPSEVLNPVNTWQDQKAYYEKANKLVQSFYQNFEKYADHADDEIKAGAPSEVKAG